MRLYETSWDYLGLSRTILDYLRLSRTRVQVKAGEGKLLLFWNFFLIFFLIFTRAISRGARAPKKDIIAKKNRDLIYLMTWYVIMHLILQNRKHCKFRIVIEYLEFGSIISIWYVFEHSSKFINQFQCFQVFGGCISSFIHTILCCPISFLDASVSQ